MQHIALSQNFQEGLAVVIKELRAFPNEEMLWQTVGDIKNPAGNLAFHIIGNLNHFIGAQLGNTGYVRKRDEEFSRKDLSRKDLIKMLEAVSYTISQVMRDHKNIDLDAPYSEEVFGKEMTTGYFLTRLVGHLQYHLGQINYLRRVLTAQ